MHGVVYMYMSNYKRSLRLILHAAHIAWLEERIGDKQQLDSVAQTVLFAINNMYLE